MTNYITNLCTNPSFEAGLSGWSALGGTTLSQDATYVLYGQSAMMVITDGASPAEGFYGPSVSVGSTTTCSASLSLYSLSAGTVTLSAVNGSGVVLATATVNMISDWQRVQVSDFTVTGGGSFHIVVQTTSAQALQFWVDAAQMETGVTAASAYIDGDQPGCSWLGTPELSASDQPYQYTATASGTMMMSGRAAPVHAGEVFDTSASGRMTMSGDAHPGSSTPVAAFDDFALFELSDPDPAMTYVDQNTAGTDSGNKAWAEGYGLFYPPLDYPVSGGKYAWRRAAYMAAGLKFGSVAAGEWQNVSDVQVALSPITGSSPVPLTWTPPRQIETIIKPTRLNFCTNPSFEVSASGWSGVGTGTIGQDSTTSPLAGWLTLAPVGSIGSYLNTSAISNDGATGTGNFDGSGNSYSAQALAAAGIVPGGQYTTGGITYLLPNSGPGQADCVAALSQVIPAPAPQGASVVAFLGAAAGAQSGTVTITYTDGTTGTATLALSDWANGSPSNGNQIAAALPYRNNRNGTSSSTTVYLFTQTIAVNTAKTVASITLPGNNAMHIFAVSLAEPEGLLTGSNSGKVTVNANGDGAQISIGDLIVGDTYIASFYYKAGAGLSDIVGDCSGGSVTVSNITGGIPYGGEPGYGYGEGPYGGVFGGATDLPTGLWERASFTFVAAADTETFEVSIVAGSDVSYPTYFWLDGVMVEAGTALQPYFDGSYGAADYLDYQWEGTAGLSRSYYYEQLAVKKYTISQILASHTPLGISYATPSYLVPYSQ